MRWKLKQLNGKLCWKSPALRTHMVLKSIYATFWDNFCEKAPSKIINVKVRRFWVLCGKWLKASQTHTHTLSQTGPGHFVSLPCSLISLETSPRQITSCSAVSVPKQHHRLVPRTHSTTHINTLSRSVPLALAFTQNAISCALIWSALGTESPRHSFPMIPVWHVGWSRGAAAELMIISLQIKLLQKYLPKQAFVAFLWLTALISSADT